MDEEKQPIRIQLAKHQNEVILTERWFLDNAETYQNGDKSRPVDATFKALVNGETAFAEVYEAINNAKRSVDIAIWGFQPSMCFKRGSDDKTYRIGDLLIIKAYENVQIRLLVWSMWFHAQTFVHENANLGGMQGVKYRSVTDVIRAQEQYDYYWYMAIKGELHLFLERTKMNFTDPYLKDAAEFKEAKTIFNKSRINLIKDIEANYSHLVTFSRTVARKKIQYKNRRIALFNDTFDNRKYFDKNLPWQAELTLSATSSHHQKTVLIDYELPECAVGFVMEHNMIDNYWDTNEHHYGDIKLPHLGKNVNTPLQDVSSVVTGEVLWDINYNFCQSWDRNGLFENRGNYEATENLTQQRQHLTREMFIPNEKFGHQVKAQTLRTYDEPRVTDIQKIYLQNIKKTVSYIYTENQYFRYPPLVETFLTHWEKMRQAGRTSPIYWFAVTNSSDDGLGKGTYTTNQMLKLLGRQDVMPNVVRQLKIEEIQTKIEYHYFRLTQPNSHSNPSLVMKEIDELKKQKAGLEEEIKKTQKNVEKGIDQKELELLKKLEAKIDQTPGIKSHICTLASANSWDEVYVHSKVTIMDDVFTIISSANLNTRSMEKDTELGIVIENGQVARELRQTLWGLHTKNDSDANPPDLHDHRDSEKVFNKWKDLINANQSAREKGEMPKHPLRQFFRADPKVSRLD
ncbi:phospholipase D-like domain-containing protein [Avibacterium sp. 21-594]|uniref:phospholipase D-like domain-containing protein n=1 Tax=Avibacterium sp. 21-594 TaxID=2911535 RepID=UPI0022453499|nr:phospholipase D-like domain-containing protein [Avibacterium sp. 21-594]MCW9716029.1 phospholipase D-like domain-containing protein [Avibacterium sp. 21-594]